MSAAPKEPSIEISLTGMRFHVCVGVLPHERELAQPLEIDLVVRHDAVRAGVLDYRGLYEATRDTVHSDERTYLEALAERIAARVLAMDGVRWTRVAIRKPHVPIGGPLDYVQVAVERDHG